MKKQIYISAIAFAAIFSLPFGLSGDGLLFAQITHPQIGNLNGINYQAVAIDEYGKEIVGMDINGQPVYEKTIQVRFSITKGSAGALQYQETHATLTDRYGLFSLVIGAGTQTGAGQYAKLLDMPWIDADQFLKVEIATKNDGNYKMVSNQQFMSVPYSFYTDDIADDAITTWKIEDETIQASDIDTGAVTTSEILNFTIINEDIATGAVDSRTILNETIQAIDIDTGAVTTSEILNFTIINEDIATGAVDSRTILDETILANDIATGAVTTSEILDETILAEDIATGAVTTSEILNETILAEDIATGAVTTSEILDGTILNEDIANGTIDLTTKVTGILPVPNGGTGASALTANSLLVGNGTGAIQALGVAVDGALPIGAAGLSPVLNTLTAGTGIVITNAPGSITITSGVTGVNSSSAGNVQIGVPGAGACAGIRQLNAGSTWVSPSIPLAGVAFGNIIVGSVDESLKGCMMSTYVDTANQIRVSIFNGTTADVCFTGNNALRVLVVQ